MLVAIDCFTAPPPLSLVLSRAVRSCRQDAFRQQQQADPPTSPDTYDCLLPVRDPRDPYHRGLSSHQDGGQPQDSHHPPSSLHRVSQGAHPSAHQPGPTARPSKNSLLRLIFFWQRNTYIKPIIINKLLLQPCRVSQVAHGFSTATISLCTATVGTYSNNPQTLEDTTITPVCALP